MANYQAGPSAGTARTQLPASEAAHEACSHLAHRGRQAKSSSRCPWHLLHLTRAAGVVGSDSLLQAVQLKWRPACTSRLSGVCMHTWRNGMAACSLKLCVSGR